MFGLVSKKKYDELNRTLTKKLISNSANEIRVEELEDKLKLEITKSTYWKIKSQNNNADIVVVGSKEDIEYIKDEMK